MLKRISVPPRRGQIVTRSLRKSLRQIAETMAEESKVLKHEIITNQIQLPPYSRDPEDIDLESYIARIDNYIATKGLKNDQQMIEAFKANIHPHKGPARSIIICRNFVKEIKTYKDYLEEFRKHFLPASDTEPLRVHVKFLGIQQRGNETMTQYISRLDTFSKQLEDNLKGTPWTDTNNPNMISLRQLSKILMMSKIIHKTHNP